MNELQQGSPTVDADTLKQNKIVRVLLLILLTIGIIATAICLLSLVFSFTSLKSNPDMDNNPAGFLFVFASLGLYIAPIPILFSLFFLIPDENLPMEALKKKLTSYNYIQISTFILYVTWMIFYSNTYSVSIFKIFSSSFWALIFVSILYLGAIILKNYYVTKNNFRKVVLINTVSLWLLITMTVIFGFYFLTL